MWASLNPQKDERRAQSADSLIA